MFSSISISVSIENAYLSSGTLTNTDISFEPISSFSVLSIENWRLLCLIEEGSAEYEPD